MAEALIIRRGGSGGASLNFKVVGGTSVPTNPTENTIWVNTSTKITDWVFSATQPTAASGRVWIPTGTSSLVEFNALKKNGIQVYPISVKQYVGGAWVDKTAKSYQGGKWVEWIPNDAWYFRGEEYVDITGGWVFGYDGDGMDKGTGAKGTSDITITIGYKKAFFCGTVNNIDLTNVKTIKINVKQIDTSASFKQLCIIKQNGKLVSDDFSAKVDITKTGETILDVSGKSGYFRIAVYYGHCSKTANLVFDEVRYA